MKYAIGYKSEMTQLFDENGKIYPVTVINLETPKVIQVKTDKKDGYSSIQIGFGKKNKNNINKPISGHLKDLGDFRTLKEIRGNFDLKAGDVLENTLESGEKVQVTSISKSKGFQGVVKRHGFAGGPRTHGQKHSEREGGSIGAGGYQRVFKGTRMPGRMGGDQITVKNLLLVSIDKENNKLFIKGAVPGRRGTIVEVKIK